MRACHKCKIIFIQVPCPLVELCDRLEAVSDNLGDHGAEMVEFLPLECKECGGVLKWVG